MSYRTLFQKLAELNVYVPENIANNKWFCTWDLESRLSTTEHNSKVGLAPYKEEHVPLAVSIASTIPNYVEAKVFLQQVQVNL